MPVLLCQHPITSPAYLPYLCLKVSCKLRDRHLICCVYLSCTDMQDGSSACFIGSCFSNHDRLPAGASYRRSLWSQKLSFGGHSLFNFAKTRHPLLRSKPLNDAVSTSAIPFPSLPADVNISPTDVFSPSLSFSTSASITPTQGSSGLAPPLPPIPAPMLQQRKYARPSIAPAPQRFHARRTAPVPSRLPIPGQFAFSQYVSFLSRLRLFSSSVVFSYFFSFFSLLLRCRPLTLATPSSPTRN